MILPKGCSSSGFAPLVRSRREFLRSAAVCTAGSALIPSLPVHAFGAPGGRMVVIVTFGGGARDEETFAPDGQENIPGLIKTLLPQSTFFGQVINRGILGHYVGTTSIATGVYETFNNFSGVAPPNPTLFEYFRKGLKRPSHDAWLISPSSGFRNMGCSTHQSFGAPYGAGVILPKMLLSAAAPDHGDNSGFNNLLRETYEEPHLAAGAPQTDVQLEQLERVLRFSPAAFARSALNMESADQLSVYVAKQLMTQAAPSLLWITLHDIDVAHS